MGTKRVLFIRYPGGKGRMLDFLLQRVPGQKRLKGPFVDPFVGGGALFFALKPSRALLSDINRELIDLYRGIRRHPGKVWSIFRGLPSSKPAYYAIRGWNHHDLDLAVRAARTLYLNRTCFKGMWRHNSAGNFNIGYGGQDRRWVLSRKNLMNVSKLLRRARFRCADFEELIDGSERGDFLYLDPPYRPGEREMNHDHYSYGRFSFNDHRRLAGALGRASARGVLWAMTTSSHPDIIWLFAKYSIERLPKGTGKQIGRLTKRPGEVLIRNY